MLRIQQLKLPVTHTEPELADRIQKMLRIRPEDLIRYEIIRRSLDARKEELRYVYTVDVEVKREQAVLKRCHGNAEKARPVRYRFPEPGTETLLHRPVVVGTGPAGLFCGLMLARAGYAPILLERGQCVQERTGTVETFWKLGILDPQSNVQFGEGGAGTFSDGKLNTLVKDPAGRNRKVLELFVEAGAPDKILYEQKPHLGTDLLVSIVRHMREEILKLGGEVRFGCRMTDLVVEKGRVRGVITEYAGQPQEFLNADQVVLAVGHSARDTFAMLKKRQIPMQAKSFAVGVRMEHPQDFINNSQYGENHTAGLPAAAYKLTAKAGDGRGVYTFCMCPGGFVVNASSTEGLLAVNGMSYSARDGKNANSAVIVTVTPEDFESDSPLAGMEFQKKLEEAAFLEGGGRIPVQLFEDYRKNCASTGGGTVVPQIKGSYTWGNVRHIFPEQLALCIEQGILQFDTKIKGFARCDAVLSGVESRTSSPLRILRDESLQSSIRGLYPCGEGAGYAGGITSAAIDGLKVTESIIKEWCPFDTAQVP